MGKNQLVHTVIIALSVLIGTVFIARAIRDSPRYEYQWFPGYGDRVPGYLRIENKTGHIEYYLSTQGVWLPW